MKLIVGMSGASGSVFGVKLLEHLKKAGVETHLIMTETAKQVLEHETNYKVKDVEKLAAKSYKSSNFFASVASGSFKTDGMVVVPCSMKTVAGIASGFTDNLLLRAADVCLKERKKLVLVARETPLSAIHLENMLRISRAGGIILPPVMTYYSKPKSIDEMSSHIIGKVMDQFGLDVKGFKRWK